MMECSRNKGQPSEGPDNCKAVGGGHESHTTAGIVAFQLTVLVLSFLLAISFSTENVLATDWEVEIELSSDTGAETQDSPSVAVDGNYVHVVWVDYGDGDGDIFYRRYDGTTWLPEIELSSDVTIEAQETPAIAAESGKVYVVWRDSQGGNKDIFYRYFNGASWSSEQEISTDSPDGEQRTPDIAVDAGKVHVVWDDRGGFDPDIHYRYFNGASWQTEQKISTDGPGIDAQTNPSVAAEGNKVYVTWEDHDDGNRNILLRLFNGASWESEQEVSVPVAGKVQWHSSVAVEAGVVHVVWEDGGTADYDVYYRKHDGISWLPIEEISSDFLNERQLEPTLAVDSGRVHVVWADGRGGDYDIFYRCHDGTDWLYYQEISTDTGSENQNPPAIAVGNGLAHVVWPDGLGGDYDIHYRRGTEDLTDPQSNVDPITPYWKMSKPFAVPWSATDDLGLLRVYLEFRYSTDNSSWSNWESGGWDLTVSGTSASGSFSFSAPYGDGFYQFRTWAMDTSYRSEEPPAVPDAVSCLDTSPPVGSVTVNNGDIWTASHSVNLTLMHSDSLSGVSKVRYGNDGTWDTEPWENPSATKSWVLSAVDGMKSVYYQIKDNAGVESSTFFDDIGLDTMAPTGSIVINNNANWTRPTSVQLSLVYSDPGSGVSQVRFSNDGVWDTEPWETPFATKSWSVPVGDGMKTVYCQLIDWVGWVSMTYSDEIGLDSVQPTGSIVVNNNDEWTNSESVTLTLTFSDATSGVSSIRLSNDFFVGPEPWESPLATRSWDLGSGDGARMVYYQVKDNAGIESSIFSDGIGLDTLHPTGSIVINEDGEWTAETAVTLMLTFTDASSGVDVVRYGIDGVWDTEPWEAPSSTKLWTLSAGDGTRIVFYQIRDKAGVESATYSDAISLDTAPPTGSIVINEDDVLTNSASVTLTLTYTDELSGVSQVRFSNDGVMDNELWELPTISKTWTLPSGDGIKTVYFQVIDQVGLVSDIYSDNIEMDTTAPLIVSITPSDGTTDVDPSTTIVVSFSEEMNRSATQSSFRLRDSGVDVPGTMTWSSDGRNLSFFPTGELEEGSTYSILTGLSAEDLAGNPLTALSTSFTTSGGQAESIFQELWWILVIIIAVVVGLTLAMLSMKRKSRVKEKPPIGESKSSE